MVDELVAEVEAARTADAVAAQHRARVDELLLRVRQETNLGLPEIEQAIGRFYDRATISRKTSGALGKSRSSST